MSSIKSINPSKVRRATSRATLTMDMPRALSVLEPLGSRCKRLVRLKPWLPSTRRPSTFWWQSDWS